MKKHNTKITDLINIFESPEEKRGFTLTALAAVSGILTNVAGTYDGRVCYPNLYSAIIAPPASGKGVVKYSAALLAPVHRHYRSMTEAQYEAHRVKAEANRVKPTPFYLPDTKSLYNRPVPLIGSDITKAMLLQQLQANDACPSVLISDELDTLGYAAGSEHGKGLSTILRCSFQNERLTQQLKGGSQILEINEPKLALAFAGTNDQLVRLIGNLENGLFSRFLIIYQDNVVLWRNVNKGRSDNRDSMVEAVAAELLQLHLDQIGHPLEVELTSSQWEKVNEFGRKHEASVAMNVKEELIPIVRRHALLLFKTIMVLTALRRHYDCSLDRYITCTDEDFKAAYVLVTDSLSSALKFAQSIDRSSSKPFAPTYKQLLDCLPIEFSRNDAVAAASGLPLKGRSIDRALAYLVNAGILEKIAHGTYRKLSDGKV